MAAGLDPSRIPDGARPRQAKCRAAKTVDSPGATVYLHRKTARAPGANDNGGGDPMTHLTLAVLTALGVVAATRADDAKPVQQEKYSEKAGLHYLLYLPPGHDKAGKPLPLLLFLHGAGETGKDLKKVKVHGPPKVVEKKRDFGFIVVSPQAPRRGWSPRALLA